VAFVLHLLNQPLSRRALVLLALAGVITLALCPCPLPAVNYVIAGVAGLCIGIAATAWFALKRGGCVIDVTYRGNPFVLRLWFDGFGHPRVEGTVMLCPDCGEGRITREYKRARYGYEEKPTTSCSICGKRSGDDLGALWIEAANDGVGHHYEKRVRAGESLRALRKDKARGA